MYEFYQGGEPLTEEAVFVLKDGKVSRVTIEDDGEVNDSASDD